MRPVLFILSYILLNAVLSVTEACEMSQTHRGCKIQDRTCICGFGCKSEFIYSSRNECQGMLRERGSNVCARLPCMNRGTCTQISQVPGYKCRCEGTGFYGTRCEKPCPKNEGARAIPYPYQCVEI